MRLGFHLTMSTAPPLSIKNSFSNYFRHESLIVWGSGITMTLLAAVFYAFTGYPAVTTFQGTLDIIAPPIYMLPIFFVFGNLVGEVFWLRLGEEKPQLSLVLGCESLLLGLFSAIRLLFRVPISGHALILTFYLLHQVLTNKKQYPFRIGLAMLLLVQTFSYKILIWEDPVTLFLGILVGLTLWLPGSVYRCNNPPTIKE